MFSRRDFAKLALAGVPASLALAKINSTVKGVMIGAQTYSFRDRPVDQAIEGMKQVGLGYAEVWSGHIEPKTGRSKEGREQLRKWRETVSMTEYEKVRDKFNQAGIEIYALNYSFRDDFSDAEIARGFEMAKALGVKRLTASANVSTAKRVDPYAKKAGVLVGMHNHSRIRENEFARAEDFEQAMAGMSNIKINLDIGHFWGAGFDPVPFIRKHHASIITLHVKDKTKADDQNKPFGEGDTPIRETLQLLSENRYRIPAMIEYEYKGADTVAEVKKCFEYLKKQLA